MKKVLLFLAMAMASHACFAAIRTVNNTSGSTADFTTIAAAINASQAGDTVYVQPSATVYASAVLDKRLVLMGAGHNPSFSPYRTSITTIMLQGNASNSIIKGIAFNTLNSNSTIVCNNLVVSGCFITNPTTNPFTLNTGTYNSWVFEGCVFFGEVNMLFDFAALGSNLIIRNCYVQSATYAIALFNLPSGTWVDHCIIYVASPSFGYGGPYSGTNVLGTNNVFISDSGVNYGADYNCTACQFNNNMLWNINGSASFPGTLNNTNFFNVNPIFVNFNYSSFYNYLWNLRLGAESTAVGAANDGSDIGIYGGIFDFSSIGADAGTPQILDLQLGTSTAPAGGTITIHLNANGSGQ